MSTPRKVSALALGLALAALTACGDDSAKTSSGVGPETKKDALRKRPDQQQDQGKTKGGVVIVPGQGGKKDDVIVVPPKGDGKKDDVIVIPPKHNDVIVLPPVQDQGQAKGLKGHKQILQGQWAYQGCACLPTQQQLTTVVVGGLVYQFTQGPLQGQGQWQNPGQGQWQNPGQGQVVTLPTQHQKSFLKFEGDVVQVLVEQNSVIVPTLQDKYEIKDEYLVAQGQSQAKIKLPTQQQQGDFEQSLVVEQDKTLFVTQQDQDCPSGKTVQKYQK
jgi:hypothetical protein